MREVGTFSVWLDQNPIYDSDPFMILDVSSVIDSAVADLDARWKYTVSFFLESLRLSVNLPSFPKAKYPITFPDDSTAERAQKLMQVEEQYPKCGLAFLRKKASDAEWMKLSTINLQNRGRESHIPIIVPYLSINQLKILSRNDQLAIQKIDYGEGSIGHGLIIDNRALDYVQIEGEYRFDIDIEYAATRPHITNQRKLQVSNIPQILLPSNRVRAYFEIQNQSTSATLLYGFGENSAVLASGFRLRPGEMYHPFNTNGYIPTESIWVRAETEQIDVAVMECSYL